MTTTPSLELAHVQLVRPSGEVIADLDVLQGSWTVQQYLHISDQLNHLIEFTDGYIEVLPIPTRKLQAILALFYELFVAVIRPRGGQVFFAPLRLQLASGRFREPDLLLLVDKRDPRNQEAFWMGADLVVEIVSPDNPDRDLVDKRRDYAEAGIAEYWSVNPIDETVTVLTLDGDTYAEHGMFAHGTSATSVLLPSFAVDVDSVFDAQ